MYMSEGREADLTDFAQVRDVNSGWDLGARGEEHRIESGLFTIKYSTAQRGMTHAVYYMNVRPHS